VVQERYQCVGLSEEEEEEGTTESIKMKRGIFPRVSGTHHLRMLSGNVEGCEY